MIKNLLPLVIFLLFFLIGCSQQTEDKDPTQPQKVPISKKSSLPSSKNNNSSEETEMKIAMMAKQKTYPLSTNKVNVIITNNSSKEYNTGLDYSIEYYNGSVWNKIPLEFIVKHVMAILPPQEEKEFSIYLHPEKHDYQSGKYRIIKTVSSNDGKYILTAEFNIQ